jgi:3-phenylpropionate/cinnamic acid dioxygenase small subunit
MTVQADLYAEIQQFYAEHMQLLDDGKVEEWAAKFTEDGTFATDIHPQPARGRTAIVTGARQVADQLAAQGVVRRHWLGMSAIAREDETLRVRSYALVLQSTVESGTQVRTSTTCEDVLVPVQDGWRIRERTVHNDVPPT